MSELAEVFRDLSSSEYEYADPDMPGAAPGKHVGPMAQELEDLSGVVAEGEDGVKRVDDGRLSLANASMLGEHERRLRALEDLS